jgi:glycosyltransferase involved in cell wall biosynthesis
VGIKVVRSSENREAWEDEAPSCVHFHGIWSPALARRAIYWRRRGVPYVVSLHGMLEPWALNHKGWKKRLALLLYQRAILNHAAALHATSEREAENLRKLGFNSRIVMIPWGIDMPETANDIRFAGRQKPKPLRTALFVGRIFPVKGLPLLVEAWEKVRPVGWKMKIVGPDEGGHRAEVEALIHKSGLEGDFEFTGPLQGIDLNTAYDEADLFILPSYSENFSLVVGEALARGLPVIASHGVPWDALPREQCGWWVPASAGGIAEGLAQAKTASPEVLIEMGHRGQRLIENSYSWGSIAPRFVDFYSAARMSI